MLMMVSSGLTRYEAQKAQKTTTIRQETISKTNLFLPLLMTLAGVSSLILVMSHSWLLTALVAILASLTVMVIAYLAKAITRHQGQPQQPVLVVRDGLVRQVRAQDLVVGDVLMLTAGEKLPVDVALAPGASVTLPRDLAGLLILLNRRVPTGVGIAGAVMATDTQATVTAVLNDGLLDHGLKQLAGQSVTTTPTSLVTSAVAGMKLVLQQICRIFRLAVSVASLEMLKNKQIDRDEQIRVEIAFAHHATLVGAMKHHSKTSDFRHNQDPVS